MRSKVLLVALTVVALGACSPNTGKRGPGNGNGDGGAGDGGPGPGGGDGGFNPFPDGGIVNNADGGFVVGDPTTCADAAANKTYIGCDYWPTVVGNQVWSIFDFAVVVSNPGTATAMVTVTGPSSTNQTVMVPPDQLVKIYLPWVPELKGPDQDAMTAGMPMTASVVKAQGAYHLVSSIPVIVYQFSALEYKGAGGPAGKDWSTCPGTGKGGLPGCFSFTNDASLLLPSTAMTNNYRVVSEHGVDGFPGLPPIIPASPGMPSYFAITATQDATMVTIQTTGQVLAGGGITAMNAGQKQTFMLNAGDVAEVVGFGAAATDLTGSQVQSTKPVQVIGGIQCIANPQSACDHLEETVMPAETLGKDYVVTVPTGPNGTPVGQTVRFVGNVDGTKLTYNPAVSGAPATLNAGQVVELANVASDFEVTGDHEFIVSTIMLSGSLVDPNGGQTAKGDPSLSMTTAVEQYRLKYVFLAPDDYDVNYVDIVAPMGAKLTLDGAALTTPAPVAIGSSGYGVVRVKLMTGMSGAHVLSSDLPIGIQVSGYGSYTSYQYPGGLDLRSIAPPPTPIG